MPNTLRTFGIAAAATATVITGSALIAPAIVAQDAPQQKPGQLDPSRVSAGTYSLDPSHTLVQWRLDHFGFNDYFGLFGQIEGTMTLDPDNIEAAEFEIMVPISEVTTASEPLNEHLLRPGEDGKDPDFFGPNPGMATFTSTSVTQTGTQSAIVNGMLEMNGRSGPVALTVDFAGAGSNPFNEKATVGFEGRGVIDRTKWGIDYGQGLIGNDVELIVTAAFEMDSAM